MSDHLLDEQYAPASSFVQNVPSGKDGNKYYYFLIRRADWNDGKWMQNRMKLSQARRIAATDFEVKWSEGQYDHNQYKAEDSQ